MEKRNRRIRRNLRKYKRRKFLEEYGNLLFIIVIISLLTIPSLIFLFLVGWEYSLTYLILGLFIFLVFYILKRKQQKKIKYSNLKKI